MTSVNNVSAASKANTNKKTPRAEQYVVKSGETLSAVAKKFNMTVEEFKSWTGLTSNNLKAGQKINLPTDTVPAGKGIYALAKKYSMTLSEFCKLNNIPQPYDKYTAAIDEKFYVITKKPQSADTSAKTDTTKQATPEVEPQSKPETESETTPEVKPEEKSEEKKADKKEQKPIYQPTNAAENKRKWNSSFTPDELAQLLYKAVDKNSGAVGKPVFDELLKEINPKNVEEVIKAYDNLGKGESLINAITSEIRSDKQLRKDAVMHIYDALAQKRGISPDVRESFTKELDKQFNSFGTVGTKKLDKTISRMMKSPDELAKDFEKSFKQWGAVGKEDFDELLKMVKPENVEEIIKAYDKSDTGESLINAITSEIKSDKQLRKDAVMRIYDALAEKNDVNSAARDDFKKILDTEFDSFGMVDTKKMDNIINSIMTGDYDRNALVSADKAKSSADVVVHQYKFKGKPVKATGEDLRKGAQKSAARDPEFADTGIKPEDFERPLPYINSDNKIEAASALYLPDESHSNGPLKGKVVILNAGHGGYCPSTGAFDAGTVGVTTNAEGKKVPIEEWKIADTYIKDLTQKLNDKGAVVVFVSGPVENGTGGMFETKYLENLLKGQRGSNEIRDLLKHTKKSDMAFMAIHVESVKNKPEAKKCTVRANNDDGDKALAESICKYTKGHNLEPVIATNNYYVTRAMGDEIPAVLVELGNIANPHVVNSLLSRKDRSAYTDALASALQETLLK